MTAPTIQRDTYRNARHWATIYARRYSRPYAILSVGRRFYLRPADRCEAFADRVTDVVEPDRY